MTILTHTCAGCGRKLRRRRFLDSPDSVVAPWMGADGSTFCNVVFGNEGVVREVRYHYVEGEEQRTFTPDPR